MRRRIFGSRALKNSTHFPAEQALAEIDESDHRREEYLRTRTEKDWHDARNYHVCLDAQAAGFELAADTIIALAQKMKPQV